MSIEDRSRSERGAITIHVAIALVALLAFSAMVIDKGPFFVARRQAQNAADAGALAGALSLQFAPTALAQATAAAKLFAGQNVVWGQTTAAADIRVSPLPYNCPDGIPSCIQVDVSRGLPNPHDGSAHTNSMPTFLMNIVGVNSQGVRATATAQVAAGNAVKCIKPWIVADRWVDNTPASASNPAGWDQTDVFNPGVDTYTSTSGFSAATDIGYELMLKGDGQDFAAGWSLEIDLNGGNGGNVYRDEIGTCPAWVPAAVGLYDGTAPCLANPGDVNYEKGCLNVKTGVKQGPTEQGAGDLVALDPGASWDTTTNTVTGGCTAAGTCQGLNPLGFPISPRIVPVALFNPQAYAAAGFSGGNGMVQVVNLFGFFVEGMCSDVYPNTATRPVWCGPTSVANKTVVGRFMKYPGQSNGAAGSAGPSTFLTFTRLIR